MSTKDAVSERVRLRRHAERGSYDPEVIEGILDEAYFCHVGFVAEGHPVVLPTVHVRLGDWLYLHGAAANAMFAACAGQTVCVTATILDGLVLARSVYDHSMNFRSVVVFGVAEDVVDAEEKRDALRALVDHVVAGRSLEAKEPTELELKATRVLRVSIDEASAKVRTGPPKDAVANLALGVWAGVVPLRLVAGEPVQDVQIAGDIPLPGYLQPERLASRQRRGESRPADFPG